MAVKDISVLTGTTNSSQIEPVFVDSDDCQVIEDGNKVDCLGIVSTGNDIQAVEYGIVGSNRQLSSDADSVSVKVMVVIYIVVIQK